MPGSSRWGRGGGWVAAQFVLMAAILVLVVDGLGLVVWAARTLGPALTPYPVPGERATLVADGPYRVVRHPIYVAGVLVFLGYGLLASVPATAAVPLLAGLWHFKAGVEERHLAERFPGYGEYSRRVRRGI